MRILIAEDSTVSRRLLERTLERWGYEVVSCEDGTEAWNAIQSEDAPPLVILDWMMPGRSGPEICRLIRKLPRQIYTYVVLLTSKAEKQDLVEGMDAGADDYLTKPFDHHELNARLRAGRRILELQEQLLQAQEALRDQATRDALTGLWNRRSILEMLDRETSRAAREQTSVGVIILDLDHFKAVNDTLGHLAGDEVLRVAARRMLNAVRPYDFVGRYGGEEFLILLPGCDMQSLEMRCEQIRAAIADLPAMAGDAVIPITASFGAVVFQPGMPATADALIRLADAAMYEAKALGRNRVVLRGGRSGQYTSR